MGAVDLSRAHDDRSELAGDWGANLGVARTLLK
jgi:hypothetical protein